MKRFLCYITLVLLIVEMQIVPTGCANIVPPQGGFRDSLPPILVHATPGDSSSNFSEKRITLTFDEFVELQNVRENLIVSPVPKVDPIVESKLRTVTVRLKDTLQPNTTYTLNFGNSIKDVNEGNVAKNFTYLFSTGPHFDSLTLTGQVFLAESGKPDSALVVMLHQSGDDSAVVNQKPRYLARLDSAGRFRFRNLPAGTFYIYALEDQGGGHRYLSEKQLFAFADSPVVVQPLAKPVTLYAFAGEKSTTRSGPAITPQVGPKQRGKQAEKRLKIQPNLSNGQLDLLGNLVITFEQPLKNLDTSLIHFSRDSSFTPLSGYQIFTDTSKKQLTLQYKWDENTLYHVIFEKNFAEDTMSRGLLKTDTLTFRSRKLSDYGSLEIRFRNFDPSVNPVLLFVQSDNVVKAIPLTSSRLNLQVFPPGEYELRLLYDRNKNGKWDPGQFFGKHIQPEFVKPVSRRISVKPHWDNQFDIQL